jgi:hypothetical protein
LNELANAFPSDILLRNAENPWGAYVLFLKAWWLAFFADGVLDSGKAGVALSEGQTFRALLDQSLQRTTLNGLRTNGRHMPLPEWGVLMLNLTFEL